MDENDDDARSIPNSVYQEDPERAKERAEADSHMKNYINDQLNRYVDDKQPGQYEHAEEFETRAADWTR